MSTTTKPAPDQEVLTLDPRPAPGPAPDKTTFIRVRTTLPRRPTPANAVRTPIVTERLVLRPLTPEDVAPIHVLRTQPEVMRWTALGRVDRDVEETRAKVQLNLPPRDVENYNFAICARRKEDGVGEGGDGEAGEVIGIGGCHIFTSSFGWPEVGYMLRKEYWSKGLGTEFLRGFLDAWDALEREEIEIEVDARTVDEEEKGEGLVVRERLIAVTAPTNDRSHGVLKKSGFEWFTTWLAEEMTEGVAPGTMIELPTFRRLFPGKKAE